jgi:hypothetical protein
MGQRHTHWQLSVNERHARDDGQSLDPFTLTSVIQLPFDIEDSWDAVTRRGYDFIIASFLLSSLLLFKVHAALRGHTEDPLGFRPNN